LSAGTAGRRIGLSRLHRLLCAIACAVSLSAAAQSKPSDVDATARLIAGLVKTVPDGVKLSEATLHEYARNASSRWSEYERRIGEPMQKWAHAELEQKAGGTVFYPFSGPDFATVYRLYPLADRYVLVALQRAERPPQLARASAVELSAFLARFGESWKQFAQIGFFRTLDLDDEAKQTGVRAGTTAPMIAFGVRSGFKILAVDSVRINAEGTDLEPHPDSPADSGLWASVRITMEREGRKVRLDYVRLNLADASLDATPGHRAWIERMAANRTVLKAASHLPQDARFKIVRDALLTRAPSIVQDETGIEYTRLVQAFNVKLYGRFSKPHPIFNQESQRALAQAYKAAGEVKPLPFRVSYQRQPEANLQVAVRARP
jgi:hypothetical protein